MSQLLSSVNKSMNTVITNLWITTLLIIFIVDLEPYLHRWIVSTAHLPVAEEVSGWSQAKWVAQNQKGLFFCIDYSLIFLLLVFMFQVSHQVLKIFSSRRTIWLCTACQVMRWLRKPSWGSFHPSPRGDHPWATWLICLWRTPLPVRLPLSLGTHLAQGEISSEIPENVRLEEPGVPVEWCPCSAHGQCRYD